ncbi:MAG: SiaB family protein kinase [Fluviicola sp.]|nr:SiaB family protein kinase [Fluviicola sp.]
MQISIANNETRQLLNHRLEKLNDDGFKSVQLAHFGDLNQDLINSLTINVEEMMISAGDRKPLIKRVFSILIEGLQNILLHGESMDGGQPALLIVASNETKYRVVLGNLVLATDREKLISYLDKLNGMNDEEVKSFYLEVLNNGLISTKGGAGLGFITMRMKSKDRLHYTFDTCDDGQLFFSISTDLDRTA